VELFPQHHVIVVLIHDDCIEPAPDDHLARFDRTRQRNKVSWRYAVNPRTWKEVGKRHEAADLAIIGDRAAVFGHLKNNGCL
jgi:hypothetical protein